MVGEKGEKFESCDDILDECDDIFNMLDETKGMARDLPELKNIQRKVFELIEKSVSFCKRNNYFDKWEKVNFHSAMHYFEIHLSHPVNNDNNLKHTIAWLYLCVKYVEDLALYKNHYDKGRVEEAFEKVKDFDFDKELDELGKYFQ